MSHALAHAAFSEIISPFCIVIQSDTGHSHRRPASPVKSRTSARTLGVNYVYLRGMRVAVVMIFCSFTPAPLPCPLFHNCASLTRRPSTNPHFGVFLPPVALVGDLMQSPVAVRLQVNQVRVIAILRGCGDWPSMSLPLIAVSIQVVTEQFGAFINGCSSFRGS